jgi:hypothetical protein
VPSRFGPLLRHALIDRAALQQVQLTVSHPHARIALSRPPQARGRGFPRAAALTVGGGGSSRRLHEAGKRWDQPVVSHVSENNSGLPDAFGIRQRSGPLLSASPGGFVIRPPGAPAVGVHCRRTNGRSEDALLRAPALAAVLRELTGLSLNKAARELNARSIRVRRPCRGRRSWFRAVASGWSSPNLEGPPGQERPS